MTRTGTVNDITLDEIDARELRIVKQAIIKSGIEGGQITKNADETDEDFVERWIKYVYRNEAKDKKLTEDEIPF